MKRIKIRHQTKQPKNEINIHSGMQASRMSLSWHGYCIQETIVHQQKNLYVEKISCSSAEEKSFSFPKHFLLVPAVLIKKSFGLFCLVTLKKVVSQGPPLPELSKVCFFSSSRLSFAAV